MKKENKISGKSVQDNERNTTILEAVYQEGDDQKLIAEAMNIKDVATSELRTRVLWKNPAYKFTINGNPGELFFYTTILRSGPWDTEFESYDPRLHEKGTELILEGDAFWKVFYAIHKIIDTKEN